MDNADQINDYACFILWENAIVKKNEMVEILENKFDILGKINVFWSKDNYNQNIARLYETPGRCMPFKRYNKKIGKPPFYLIIIRDTDPVYGYEASVSGKIEKVNLNVTSCKRYLRSLFDQPYLVHSSNNRKEFILQSTLLLGEEKINSILNGKKLSEYDLHKDLEGANGWDDWNSLFSILNICTEYCVLRNFDQLPQDFNESDIDFLCADLEIFCSAANVKRSHKANFKGQIKVNNVNHSVDVRFVGDSYFPYKMQEEILNNRTKRGTFFIPSQYDLFASVLYHALIHKEKISSKYMTIIKYELEFFLGTSISEKNSVENYLIKILAGIMEGMGAYYEKPIDKQVYINKKFITHLPTRQKVAYPVKKSLYIKAKRAIEKIRKMMK